MRYSVIRDRTLDAVLLVRVKHNSFEMCCKQRIELWYRLTTDLFVAVLVLRSDLSSVLPYHATTSARDIPLQHKSKLS